MLRIGLGVIVGFFAWAIVWFGAETILSAAWPAFGEHQAAFQSAIENGSEFAAIPTFLIVHIVLALAVSLIAGFFTALIAGENKRAPLILSLLLLAMGILKAAMSWTLVPMWYHVLFTAVLPIAAMVGGKLKTSPSR
jgi:hypothetical protein